MPNTDREHAKKSEKMTVQEAGQMGGQRERELVKEGHQREHEENPQDRKFGEKVERRDEDHHEST